MQKCSGVFCRKQSVENSFGSTVLQVETWDANLISKDSRKKKKSAFSGGAEWMKDEECYSDVDEEAKEGRKRAATTDEEVWSPRLTLTPVCAGSAGSRRPLSCVWSRSLAGGRVGGG